MKNKQKEPLRASALQITLAVALSLISVLILGASLASPGTRAPVRVAQEPNVPVPAVAIEKVTPAVFNGDVRDLPQIPQAELMRPELEPPFDVKQLLTEAHVPQLEAPNVTLAPMPTPLQNFPDITLTYT
jgi:hypothetical protein